MTLAPRAAGLLLGALADRWYGDPGRGHPVAGFGRAAAALERRMYADRRTAGAAHATLALAGVVVPAVAAQRWLRRHPVAETLGTAAATWVVLGGRSLAAAAGRVATAVQAGDLAGARDRVPALCGRDPRALDRAGLVRATVESVAENTSDAVVAPLLWGAVAGIPGLLGYRAVNTLDAMVGHRSPRYARFGTAAARVDDLANWVPARVTAALAVAAAPLVGGAPGAAWREWRRDGPAHPSPNAGRCEAAYAGALGVRLGGRTAYPDRVEDRPVLGAGRDPEPGDVPRALRLSRAAGWGALGLAALVAQVRGRVR